MTATPRGAVFVMPRRRDEWADAPGLWVTAAGWAAAARQQLGAAWVVTRDGVATPEEALRFTERRVTTSTATTSRSHSRVPIVVRTGVKDLLRAREARRHNDLRDQEVWAAIDLELVWQHHDPFHRAGEGLARRHRCPLVVYVHAPQVWEARQWNVKRPGWSGALEHFGDRPPLLSGDVVACVSGEVGDEVIRLGVDPARVVVSPMAVDTVRFSPEVDGHELRRQLGLTDAFVVGWMGTFRTFHGLDTVLDAFVAVSTSVPNARLLMVGDGAGRPEVERRIGQLGLADHVVLTGSVANRDLPRHVAAMDVALVSAPADRAFHYSPQKLREYLACSTPAVAPRVGDVARMVTDGVDALLYEPGDAVGMARRIEQLVADPKLRSRLGRAGRARVEQRDTWDARLRDLLDSDAYVAAKRRLSPG